MGGKETEMAKNFQRKDQQTKVSILNAKATVLKRAVESGPSLRNMVFHSPERNYDALNAVRMLKEFNAFLRNAISRRKLI